ncbi:unnamed protein product [Periconia digitata]|uniref:Tubulin-tyrosine ligase n=1 Tax=Periconia digitata TaxID=1303443 RepID=A0A9W4US43_9PLEO|nr:unnamed protein product [Periconia digitata]
MATTTPTTPKFYALVDYEDPYVEPLLLSALQTHLPPKSFQLISSLSDLPSPSTPFLQFRQYEAIDFDHQLYHPSTSLANAYVIRKALIRKHYLSTTIANWIIKYPDSVLARHVKPSVEFEVDYAEFLDDALVEAWELKESWSRGEQSGEEGREWWILKPGMSERGQGIRLFSSEEELQAIFEEWDPESSDDEEEEEEDDARSDRQNDNSDDADAEDGKMGNGIITSQLRHFIAQPYIHPPLLLYPPSPSSSSSSPSQSELRKFHIRTYVLATGALKIHVYRPMLALFAAAPYTSPSSSTFSPSTASEEERDRAMQAHLTNTCLQDPAKRDGSVGLFWDLPDQIPPQPSSSSSSGDHATTSTPEPKATEEEGKQTWKHKVFNQILATTSATFEAAARGMSIHFQPLPNSFEVFGLDFMVSLDGDGGVRTWLLEVNAFPDFRQTGDELKGLVEGLFGGVVNVGVRPFFFGEEEREGKEGDMVKVLDIDLGRR